MYESYWNLTDKPFENTPDPKYLYASSQHEEGLSRMLFVVREGKGAGMLTGVFGCGKTMLARALHKALEKDVYKIAFLTNPRMDDVDLLRMLTYYLGGIEPPQRKSDVLIKLEQVLHDNQRDGKKTVVILDEAHAIENMSIFEEIRLLLNYQLEDRFLLTVLLIGQPELKTKVDNNKQLSQRIAMRYHLENLNEQETKEYIRYRLEIGGRKDEIFNEEATSVVFKRSGGIPRRINQICDMTLFVGFGKQISKIDPQIVEEAIESLEK